MKNGDRKAKKGVSRKKLYDSRGPAENAKGTSSGRHRAADYNCYSVSYPVFGAGREVSVVG